jgi:hypothetical protein
LISLPFLKVGSSIARFAAAAAPLWAGVCLRRLFAAMADAKEFA